MSFPLLLDHSLAHRLIRQLVLSSYVEIGLKKPGEQGQRGQSPEVFRATGVRLSHARVCSIQLALD
jgi:hypothetical protein